VDANDNYEIRVILRPPDVENLIVVSARQNMTAEDIFQVIEKTLTSYQDLDITSYFQIVVDVIHMPSSIRVIN